MSKPLFVDDLVADKDNETELGVVERTHADVDTHVPYPGQESYEAIVTDGVPKKAFKKFLKDGVPPPGTVLVQWSSSLRASLILEARLVLHDRSLLIGDIVKRDLGDAMSGVVINISTTCMLWPLGDLQVLGGRGHNTPKGTLKGWSHKHPLTYGDDVQIDDVPTPLYDIPASELKYADAVNEEDLFVYKDHIGRVEELVQILTLRLLDNSVVEIREDQAEHLDDSADRFTVGDIARSRKPTLRRSTWIFGQYNPNIPPIGTIVATRNVGAEVSWLQRRIGAAETEEPPPTLDSDDLDSEDFHIYDRTRFPKRGATDAALTSVSYSEADLNRLGAIIRFRDLSGACVKYDGSTHHGKLRRLDRQDTLGYDLNTFQVARFQADVTVQWQDLSITQHSSLDLMPDSSIDDEHAAWPGEIAHTLDFARIPGQDCMTQPSRVGVVQSVMAAERMATILWCNGSQMQYLDDPEEGPGSLRSLVLGVVGPADGEQEELSLYDVETPASINVRRGDMVLLLDRDRSRSDAAMNDIDWVGEIVDTRLDGTLTVRLGACKEVRDIQVERHRIRVAIRSDGTDEHDEWEQEASGDDTDEDMDSEAEYEAERRTGLRPVHEGYEGSSGESSDGVSAESDEDSIRATYEDENGVPLDEEDVEGDEWEFDEASDDEDVDMMDAPAETPPTSHPVTPPPVQPQNKVEALSTAALADTLSTGPEQYLVLEGPAPTSHYYSSNPTTENVTHMKRVQKEHKILRTSGNLPSGVYVRTWDSRMDLIRVLFVGPAETPYADAPFLIDFYLSSTFPTQPPEAFFHSWTANNNLGGVGRVNPNLYEDGKICLSLLGTWDGGKNESWSPARSTLLQVIVSILGLVLVREPYFNEAGYEPLAGLESYRRPSALFNERIYLRANSFIVRAVELLECLEGRGRGSVDGLDDVVRWLYKDPDGKGLLGRKILEVEDVLKKSESKTAEPDGLQIMSNGACIPLRRVLARLKEL